MAIEGPLRELGIHDVFQLLDLSRKTGTLTVTSALRDNQGTVYFDRGSVLHATIRSNPFPLGGVLLRAGKISEGDLHRARSMQQSNGNRKRIGEILVETGALTQRELERQVRFQVEEVIFELLSWQEGFFSFEEMIGAEVPAEANIRISTASLMMEGARRIDEWSRIEAKVPSLAAVPVLADVKDDHPTLLDLLPTEWQVLAEIDGVRDLRAIADNLVRSEFDVAKIAYGLLATEVIELRCERPVSVTRFRNAAEEHIDRARAAARAGDLETALAAARQAVAADGASSDARLVLCRVLAQAGLHRDAGEELERALKMDPLNPELHLEAGYAAVCRGALPQAIESWQRYLRMRPAAGDEQTIESAIDHASRLVGLLTERTHV